MTQVTKQMKNKWGSYSDRKNNYDDDADYEYFIHHTKTNKELQKYLLQYIPKDVDCKWKFKPDGDYGIDLALIDVNTGKKLLCIDLERWSAWKDEWPWYYKYLHFLGRKDHFLENNEPFLIVFFEYNRNKLIIVDKDTIKKYNTINKWFSHKKCHDWVKEMKMSDGHIFGTNITDLERRNFR
tara:strand:- start:160 stop:705 length:546 start_codon:yes stop_codon:yes gene_type:complete